MPNIANAVKAQTQDIVLKCAHNKLVNIICSSDNFAFGIVSTCQGEIAVGIVRNIALTGCKAFNKKQLY